MIICYNPTLDIRNLNILPPGTGARYLEVIKGEEDCLIAKCWRRKESNKDGSILIDFKSIK